MEIKSLYFAKFLHKYPISYTTTSTHEVCNLCIQPQSITNYQPLLCLFFFVLGKLHLQKCTNQHACHTIEVLTSISSMSCDINIIYSCISASPKKWMKRTDKKSMVCFCNNIIFLYYTRQQVYNFFNSSNSIMMN